MLLSRQLRRTIGIFACSSLCAAFANSAPASKRAEIEPKDGKNYLAHEAGQAYGALLIFRKQGTEAIGVGYTSVWTVCFHGTLSGGKIKVKESVFQNTNRTKEVSYEPVFETYRDRLVEIGFYGLVPYPNPRALLPLPANVIERDIRSLNECARHFAGTEETGPCNDPTLLPTMKTDGSMKYFHSGIACRENESPNCTLDKVFEVMLATPSAIAPVKDIGTTQEVKECGILILKSFTKGFRGNNKIKTEIDFKNHSVTNYTMKGHVFYPGRVVRYLVEVDGRIDINTEGLGAEGSVKKLINIGAANIPYGSVWDTADDELRTALTERLKIPKTKQ